jgi:hypothetical protein
MVFIVNRTILHSYSRFITGTGIVTILCSVHSIGTGTGATFLWPQFRVSVSIYSAVRYSYFSISFSKPYLPNTRSGNWVVQV